MTSIRITPVRMTPVRVIPIQAISIWVIALAITWTLSARISLAQTAPAEYGLIFIYQASCPFSRKLSPALNTIANHYGLPVLAVSTDNARLSQWPDTRPDRGRAELLGINRVPFVGLFNDRTGTITTIARGALKPNILHRRIVVALLTDTRLAGENP